MTTLQLALALSGLFLWLAIGAAGMYTVAALLSGRPTVSGYLKHAHRLVVFALGLVTGFVAGLLAGHWWWPTVGG